MSGKWFFVIVILLAVAATAFLWWFNVQIQLTPEEFARQRAIWAEERPDDYYLEYLRVEDDESTGKFYRVSVHAGKVSAAQEYDVQIRERREINPPGEGKHLSLEEAQKHSLDALFQLADQLLAEDAVSGRRVYVRGRFHAGNGAMLDFVHRVMGSPRRVQINVLKFRHGAELKK
jgi:hypothetical protein